MKTNEEGWAMLAVRLCKHQDRGAIYSTRLNYSSGPPSSRVCDHPARRWRRCRQVYWAFGRRLILICASAGMERSGGLAPAASDNATIAPRRAAPDRCQLRPPDDRSLIVIGHPSSPVGYLPLENHHREHLPLVRVGVLSFRIGNHGYV